MRGVACSATVGFLEPVLETFLDNLQRYAEVMEWEDLAHYYNERTTLSLLAGACWQRGLIAVEEFVTWKGRGEEAYKGRADLWAYCPVAATDIAIEAKAELARPGCARADNQAMA